VAGHFDFVGKCLSTESSQKNEMERLVVHQQHVDVDPVEVAEGQLLDSIIHSLKNSFDVPRDDEPFWTFLRRKAAPAMLLNLRLNGPSLHPAPKDRKTKALLGCHGLLGNYLGAGQTEKLKMKNNDPMLLCYEACLILIHHSQATKGMELISTTNVLIQSYPEFTHVDHGEL
jgi:hypothetical protein